MALGRRFSSTKRGLDKRPLISDRWEFNGRVVGAAGRDCLGGFKVGRCWKTHAPEPSLTGGVWTLNDSMTLIWRSPDPGWFHGASGCGERLKKGLLISDPHRNSKTELAGIPCVSPLVAWAPGTGRFGRAVWASRNRSR